MENQIRTVTGGPTREQLLEWGNSSIGQRETPGHCINALRVQLGAPYKVIQRATAEEALYKEKAPVQTAVNSISDGVICTDTFGNIDYLNVPAENMTGWSREEARGHPIGEVFHIINGTTRQPERNPVELVLQQDGATRLAADTVLVRRDGIEMAIEDSASPIHDWDGRLTGAVIVFYDVRVARSMTIEMAHLAQHDFLSSLPNRALLNKGVAQALPSATRRHDARLSVLFLDMEKFKHLNDSFGDAAGDELLQSVTFRHLLGKRLHARFALGEC